MDESYLWIGVILLITVVILELWNPYLITEGFNQLVTVGDSAFWAKWMPRRGDISTNPHEEEGGYTRDIRYFAGYTDVQRLGQDHDFCRMVVPTSASSANGANGVNPELFFACALGGTDGLSTIKFRSPAVKDGFLVSRDDYMNMVQGRMGYGRILKTGNDTFEAKCTPSSDVSFRNALVTDSNPPERIRTLLTFYEGIMFWMRLRDDLLDYAQNLTITTANTMTMDPIPKPTTEGLEFNGIDQFLRIGDGTNLEFGTSVHLRYLRALSFWVYFEEFQNNCHVFDFGNGPNQDNVFCGIVGRGNATTQQTSPSRCLDESQKTIPDGPSGAQGTVEQSPQTALLTSSANVNLYDCPDPEIVGRIMEPLHPKTSTAEPQTADLLYEIFDNKMRKLHIQVKNVFPLKKWVHIVITTTNNDAMKPGLAIYANGKKVHTETSAWLPQTDHTTNNYIGKSNWANVTSQMDNKDELFKGKLFDFRGYNQSMAEKKIQDTYAWGKELLSVDASRQ